MRNAQAAIQRRLLDPEFLQRVIRRGLLAFAISLVLNVLLGLALAISVSHTPHVRYIYHDSLGKPRELIVTDQPYFSDAEINDWAVKKVTNLYTMNYVNYARHLDDRINLLRANRYPVLTATSNFPHISGSFDVLR
ncbi:DotI/IcmL/TraM family protein [Acetobacter indonesiensis]|uniref:DotI/IcmL/TraM family protein n=1 Tax=Acetobacter indonesiensis TaxID=104101 RepID=UPI0020A298B7|nr:DotI/IcmL/TraM family protein [Acetobacter indonesiensis]MCP1232072.1 DotI/IcmL family type IV secretion protein [Acetobacter indonesiensis]